MENIMRSLVENLENEIWAQHPYYDNIMASNQGRIKTIYFSINGEKYEKLKKQTPKTLWNNRKGENEYLYISIHNKDTGKIDKIDSHKIILETFYGPCPLG